MSGISGSRVPDNRLGYPNPNFGSGTRNVALWETRKDYFTHLIVLFEAEPNVYVIKSLYIEFTVTMCQINRNKYDISIYLISDYEITAYNA